MSTNGNGTYWSVFPVCMRGVGIKAMGPCSHENCLGAGVDAFSEAKSTTLMGGVVVSVVVAIVVVVVVIIIIIICGINQIEDKM